MAVGTEASHERKGMYIDTFSKNLFSHFKKVQKMVFCQEKTSIFCNFAIFEVENIIFLAKNSEKKMDFYIYQLFVYTFFR